MAEEYPMKGGHGTYSYVKNSQYQGKASETIKGTIAEVITETLDVKALISASKTFSIADLGCSVGPNTFFAMQNAIEAVNQKYHSQNPNSSEDLEFQVFFSDHTSNDFNTLFTSLPPERKYFAAGVPGSFHQRLFPSSSIHLAYSSYALQWLSKLPEELNDKSSSAWNKGRIHYTNASDGVVNAYASQFRRDMENFLSARAEEIVSGGLVVIIMPGLPDDASHSDLPLGILFNFLASSLMDMAKEGIIDEAEIDSLNLPIYAPTPKEMKQLVDENGEFSIEKMEILDIWSSSTEKVNAASLVMHLKAGMGATFTKHLGEKIVEEMYQRTFRKTDEISRWIQAGNKQGSQFFLVLKRN